MFDASIVIYCSCSLLSSPVCAARELSGGQKQVIINWQRSLYLY